MTPEDRARAITERMACLWTATPAYQQSVVDEIADAIREAVAAERAACEDAVDSLGAEVSTSIGWPPVGSHGAGLLEGLGRACAAIEARGRDR